MKKEIPHKKFKQIILVKRQSSRNQAVKKKKMKTTAG